jgi:hypothetical protein
MGNTGVRSQNTEDRKSLARARGLLAELDEIKGPAAGGSPELLEWNMRAQTFLVFEKMRRHCTATG